MQTNKLRASAIAWILLVPLFLGSIMVVDVGGTPAPQLDEVAWMKGAIYDESDVSNVVSEAIDHDGNLHISFYSSDTNRLMYATNAGGIWRSEVVDATTSAGKYNSIAVDVDGKVHISYSNDATSDLKYATGVFGEWAIKTIDSALTVGDFNSIACDDGKVYITYYNYSGPSLKMAIKSDNTWSLSNIADEVGQGSAMKVVDGTIYVTFLSGTSKLKLAEGNGTGWTIQDIDTSSAFNWNVAMEILDGQPCVVYYDNVNQDLKFATRVGGEWDTQLIDNSTNVAYGVSINVDSMGRVHVVYSDATLDLRYAMLDNDVWSYAILDNTVGSYKSIVSDINDKQHIVYIDREPSSYQLGYLTNSGAKWIVETVDQDDSADKYSSIAVDKNGTVHIAYYDIFVDGNVTKGRLCHVTNANLSMIETVDFTSTSVPSYPSMVVDSDGFVHISYYDSVNSGTPKYATNADGTWKNYTLDSLGNVGQYTAIAVDSTGIVHIVYTFLSSNPANNVLKYANYSSVSGLDTESIITGVSANNQLALMADSEDNLHLAYYKGADLNYAKKTGASWGTSEVVDTSDQLGGGLAMFVDGQGIIYLTYYDNGLNKLLYANNSDGTWNLQDIALAAGGASAIFVDADGDERIAYIDSTGVGILKYNERRNGIWMFQNVDLEGGSAQISMAMDSLGRAHISYFDPISNKLKYTTSIMAPSAPTNLTVNVESTILTLDWQAPVIDGGSSIIEYRVYRAVDEGDFVYLDSVAAPGLMYVDDGLENGVTYAYYIRAVNSEGTGEFSAVVTGIPCNEPGIPTLKATGGDGSVKLTWSVSDNGGADIIRYDIYKKNETNVFVLLKSVGGSVTSYTDTDVENGKDYTYYIKAVNPAGEGLPSAEVSATPDESSNTMIIIAVVIVVLAAVGVGAFFFLKKSGRI